MEKRRGQPPLSVNGNNAREPKSKWSGRRKRGKKIRNNRGKKKARAHKEKVYTNPKIKKK